MKINSKKVKNLIFLLILGLLIYPKTRLPIQVFLNKGLAQFSPSLINESKRAQLENHDWKLINEEGGILEFNDLKGKVILVNFWATWCPPCIAEMPSLESLYRDYNDKVEFVFVSNESFETINRFLTKNTYPFMVYNPLTTYPEEFNVSEIPRTIVIDKQGYVIIDKTGAANWNALAVRNTLDSLLK